MTTKKTDRMEEFLRRAHAGRDVPAAGEDTVRAVMARVRALPGCGPSAIRPGAPGLVRVLYPFAAASAAAAAVVAAWSLSAEQGLEWLVVRAVLADPTGMSALRLAGL
jgi:hypothetical protein